MSHKHRNVLEAIFRDPVSSNIQWREVESLLTHLGATVEASHGARFRVLLNKHEFFVHHPHHGNEFAKHGDQAPARMPCGVGGVAVGLRRAGVSARCRPARTPALRPGFYQP
jgi:hypothetical protein